ncbi:unnamed protein product [Paramecium octaurelia]|uniref:Uncharacterized protein n=1 Tax=Paramecium octaurelia TaxID=43137 RepID=A0A8S1U3S9_PAROT|nr:unnamed protein product [Paramecium octaurelia]
MRQYSRNPECILFYFHELLSFQISAVFKVKLYFLLQRTAIVKMVNVQMILIVKLIQLLLQLVNVYQQMLPTADIIIQKVQDALFMIVVISKKKLYVLHQILIMDKIVNGQVVLVILVLAQNIQYKLIVKVVMAQITLQSQNVIGVQQMPTNAPIINIAIQLAWFYLIRIKIATVQIA